VIPQCPTGSDPGLCLATREQAVGLDFGRRCQAEIMQVAWAVETAASRGILLRSLAGTTSGMIGALAGVCLRASGNDGRFVQVGRVRELTGRVPVAEVLASGVDRVMTEDGTVICDGNIETGAKARPALRDEQVTLFVRALEPGVWEALKV